MISKKPLHVNLTGLSIFGRLFWKIGRQRLNSAACELFTVPGNLQITTIFGKTSNTTLHILSARGVSPPPFTDIVPIFFAQNCLKIVFFATKHLKIVFLPKNTDLFSQKVAELGGTPLFGQFFGKQGVTDLGGAPPPFSDKIRKVVFDLAPKIE